MKLLTRLYEPAIFDYSGQWEEYEDSWIPIEGHNSASGNAGKTNDQFGHETQSDMGIERPTNIEKPGIRLSGPSSGCTAMPAIRSFWL